MDGKVSGGSVKRLRRRGRPRLGCFREIPQTEEGPITLTHLLAKSDLLNAKGRALLSQDGKVPAGRAQIHSDRLVPGG